MRRPRIRIAVQSVADVVGILCVQALERESRETLGRAPGPSPRLAGSARAAAAAVAAHKVARNHRNEGRSVRHEISFDACRGQCGILIDMADPFSPLWPELDYGAWQDTRATLHLWTQIVGKIRLMQTPWLNHSWHVPLYVTAKGLTTSPIAHGSAALRD